MEQIIRTEKEIYDQLEWAQEGVQEGSHYPGMPYEEGIIAMWHWLIGDNDDRPDQEEELK